MNLETSNLVHWLIIASPTLPKKNLPWKGRGQGQITCFRILHPMLYLRTANARDFSFVHGSAMWSLSLVMSECSLTWNYLHFFYKISKNLKVFTVSRASNDPQQLSLAPCLPPAKSGRACYDNPTGSGYFYQPSYMYTCIAYLTEIRKFCSKNLVHKGVNFEAPNALKLTYEHL